MKLSSKMDLLQKLDIRYLNDPDRLYLIGLLTEHTEEGEVSAEFLEWVDTLLE